MAYELKKEALPQGVFEWQLSDENNDKRYAGFKYDAELYWGGFSKEDFDESKFVLPVWAIGPFSKYKGNPVLAPSPDGWDVGKYGGGVHNGSVVRKEDKFCLVYRGEMPWKGEGPCDYICDIGLALSDDGINFKKESEHSPFFRKNGDEKFSFEDVCIVEHEGVYYLFCNRWDWTCMNDPHRNGAFLAVSKDLLHWEKQGLLFPEAEVIHRNACVLQNPHNQAVSVDGKFVMYLNDHLIAFSDDLVHWQSRVIPEATRWPGGEGCFALCDYNDARPDDILLFTGGHHTGHFYAIGEVLMSKKDVTRPIEWLPRPVLIADPSNPWEAGKSAHPPHGNVSYWRDTVFFTGMTLHDSRWWMYYGGSEYYECLAHAPQNR